MSWTYCPKKWVWIVCTTCARSISYLVFFVKLKHAHVVHGACFRRGEGGAKTILGLAGLHVCKSTAAVGRCWLLRVNNNPKNFFSLPLRVWLLERTTYTRGSHLRESAYALITSALGVFEPSMTNEVQQMARLVVVSDNRQQC